MHFELVPALVFIIILSALQSLPPEQLEAARVDGAGYWSQFLHVIVPHGGHGFDGLEGTDCLDRLFVEFVDSGTTRGLDTTCVGRIRRPPFALAPSSMKN